MPGTRVNCFYCYDHSHTTGDTESSNCHIQLISLELHWHKVEHNFHSTERALACMQCPVQHFLHQEKPVLMEMEHIRSCNQSTMVGGHNYWHRWIHASSRPPHRQMRLLTTALWRLGWIQQFPARKQQLQWGSQSLLAMETVMITWWHRDLARVGHHSQQVSIDWSCCMQHIRCATEVGMA